MRLFVAIDLPFDVKDYLRQVSVPGKKPADYHITLKFIGESEASEAINALRGISFSPFRLELAGIGAFPNTGKPRVLWVGVQPMEPVLELHSKIAEKLGRDKKFHPHITLSRLKNPAGIEPQAIEPRSFTVYEFDLIHSNLTPGGPVYQKIKTFKSGT